MDMKRDRGTRCDKSFFICSFRFSVPSDLFDLVVIADIRSTVGIVVTMIPFPDTVKFHYVNIVCIIFFFPPFFLSYFLIYIKFMLNHRYDILIYPLSNFFFFYYYRTMNKLVLFWNKWSWNVILRLNYADPSPICTI